MAANKVMYSEGGPDSEIGATLASLEATIQARMGSNDSESYTCKLLNSPSDYLLKKITEEAVEVALASKDVEAASLYDAASDDGETASDKVEADKDHLRYEAADLIYHLLVLLESRDIQIDELAAELNSRMNDDERPSNCAVIAPEHINRGK